MTRRGKTRNRDRFSNLPDEIVHKIIKRTTTVDRCRLSVVSKRCRQLCLSTPYLYVNTASVKRRSIKVAQLMNYVDRVLCLREAKHIPVFKIFLYNLSGEEQKYRLLSWLHKAALWNPAEIGISVSGLTKGTAFPLPSAFLSCKSLEKLEAKFSGGKGICTLEIPASVGFSSLKHLSLSNVRTGDSFYDWILRCCKRLEVLQLYMISGTNNVVINSSSLEVLGIHYPHMLIHLQVYAEKLRKLSLTLLTCDNTPEWKEPKLVIPNIQTFHKVLLNKSSGYIDFHEVRNKSFSDLSHCRRVCNYLEKLSMTQCLCSLRMFGDSIQKLSYSRLLPLNFPNLSVLALAMTRYNVEILSLMASFLKGTPNLQHLIIQGDDQDDVNIHTILPTLHLIRFPILPKLKDVKILLPYGFRKGFLLLAKCLINSARKIDVNVIYKYQFPQSMVKKFEFNTLNFIGQESVPLHI